MHQSSAQGCAYLITSRMDALDDLNGTISQSNPDGVELEFNRRDYDDIVYIYDWEESGMYGTLPLVIAVSDAQKCRGTFNLKFYTEGELSFPGPQCRSNRVTLVAPIQRPH